MKSIMIGRRSRAAIAAGLLAVGGLSVAVASSAAALTTANLKVASLNDHAGDCVNGATSGLIVLNQISAADAPATITVTFSDGSSAVVPLSGVNGGAAKYNVAVPSGALITGATADVPDSWSGQFVLSHYTCATTPPPSSSPPPPTS
jgi:hypothetical protein